MRIKLDLFFFLVLVAVSNPFCFGGLAHATKQEVVVYTSVDDVFARPICQDFEKQTGITVKLVSDAEETKSTGLLNRLIAEKEKPQADVFWSGDPVRAAILKRKGISQSYVSSQAKEIPQNFIDPENYWIGFSARARILLFNKDKVKTGSEPQTIMALTDPKWKGKGCMANPMFGTTSMHAAALFERLGTKGAEDFFRSLKSNQVQIVSSNGEVRRRVTQGSCYFGITDTDDAAEAIRDGKAVGVVFPDETGFGTLIVPNAVVLIKGAPHNQNAKKFIDFLLSPEIEKKLASGEAAQIPVRASVEIPAGMRSIQKIGAMKVDYAKLALRLDELSHGFLKEWSSQ